MFSAEKHVKSSFLQFLYKIQITKSNPGNKVWKNVFWLWSFCLIPPRTSCWFRGRCPWLIRIWMILGHFWRATSMPPRPSLRTCSECPVCEGFQVVENLLKLSVACHPEIPALTTPWIRRTFQVFQQALLESSSFIKNTRTKWSRCGGIIAGFLSLVLWRNNMGSNIFVLERWM